MDAKSGVHPFHAALGHDSLSAFAHFLSGLEQEPDGARQLVFHGVENLDCPQQHSSVGIMAAGVHKAVVDAFKCTTGLLLDAQSVHIRPQRHCFARLSDLGDKAGGLQPAIGYPQLIQGGSHLVGSAELLETGFRMHVEVAAEGNGFIFDLMGFFSHDVHRSVPLSFYPRPVFLSRFGVIYGPTAGQN